MTIADAPLRPVLRWIQNLALLLAGSVAALAFTASSATASDGVVELGQTCATQLGCAPGDVPGFPITVTKSGAFLLTSDLIVADGATSAIVLQPQGGEPLDVDIDMNGFSIRGPVVCTEQQGLECTGTGLGQGIAAGASGAALSVRNGTIRGVGDRAIGMTFSGSKLRAENVYAVGNGGDGFAMLEGELEDCRADRNGGMGFVVGTNASAHGRNLVAVGNGSHGFELNGRVRLVDVVAERNGGDGITVGEFSFGGNLVTGCVAQANDGTGLLLGATDAQGGCNLGGNSTDLAGGVAVAPSVCGAALCP